MRLSKIVDNKGVTSWAYHDDRGLGYFCHEDEVKEILSSDKKIEKLHTIIDLNCMQFLPPLLDGSRVFCVGLNYHDHVLEANREKPKYPSVFLRGHESFVGNQQNIISPKNSERFDYEAEVAVVIGKSGRHIARDCAWQHVAAYTLMAENSVRDFQKHTAQVTAGKNFDSSGSLGPSLITKDEVPDLSTLQFYCRLNNAIVQHGFLKDLMFDVPSLIEYISSFTQLKTGDVIALGTPAGVGNSKVPPVYLKDGDMLDIELLNYCKLSNQVHQEQ